MDVVYVDESDKEIGSGSITNALKKSIRVRIARVFIFNSKRQLLIQKRSDNHKSLPGRWDHSAAGHVDAGEDYETTAKRELAEEMGIKNIELKKLAKFYTEETDEERLKRRFNVIFVGTYDGEVKIDDHEVSTYRWISLDKLKGEISKSPESYTEGFIHALEVYLNHEKKDE